MDDETGGSMQIETMVRELWDREHIAKVPRAYSRGVDRRDWALVRACFSEDCFVDGSRASAPIDDYLAAIDERIGMKIDFPNFYPHEKGVRSRRGIISYRPLQAIYQAYRLKTLGAAKVMEIGAGLGRTAYYAHRMGIRDYTIVDIPLSNVAQAHFLSRALGTKEVNLPGEDRAPIRVLGPSFIACTDERFDVVLNVDSLSEMDPEVAAGYVAFARKSADTLVSINREWADRPRTADLLKDASVLRMPYWMRDGYVEEIAHFNA